MSAQNSLIKPTFTKSVMGYNTGEVDKYVEHVSERYNSVCKENAELKRRLLSEGVRLREAEERIAELENAAVTDKVLDKRALNKIFDTLSAEKERFAYFIESLKENLNNICTDDSDRMTSDSEWVDTLGGYIEEVREVSAPAEETVSDASKDASTTDAPSAEYFPQFDSADTAGFYEIPDDEDDGYGAETDNVLAIFEPDEGKTDKIFCIPDLEDDVFPEFEPVESPACDADESDENGADSEDSIEEDVCVTANTEEEPADTRTPAQIAADLDFYTDGDHADGESYDPMTLAAQITSRNSRPKVEDFMRPIPSDEN